MRILTTSDGIYFLKLVIPFFIPSKEVNISSISRIEVRILMLSERLNFFISFISNDKSFNGLEINADIKNDNIITRIITSSEIAKTILQFL